MQIEIGEIALKQRGLNRVLVAMLASLLLVNSAFATDGYFLTGYGAKQQGRGGTGVALPGDSLAGATNPAGLVRVGDRLDFGLTLFRPIRSGTITEASCRQPMGWTAPTMRAA